MGVIGHDDTLLRVFNISYRIDALTLEDLTAIYVEHGLGRPVLLGELLSRWPTARVNIDIKSRDAIRPVVRAIVETASEDRVCVASFSDLRLRRARRLLGERVCTAAGPLEVSAVVIASHMPRSLRPRKFPLRGAALQVPFSFRGVKVATPALLDVAHSWGLQVHIWTLNEPETIERALGWGVDGIMTDEPELLREILKDHGLWGEQL